MITKPQGAMPELRRAMPKRAMPEMERAKCEFGSQPPLMWRRRSWRRQMQTYRLAHLGPFPDM
jgi:hypothetical protein